MQVSTKGHFLSFALHSGHTHQETDICPIPTMELNQHPVLVHTARNEEHSDCSRSISLLAPQVLSNLLLGTKDNPRSLKTSSDSEDNLKIVWADPKRNRTLHEREEGGLPSA